MENNIKKQSIHHLALYGIGLLALVSLGLNFYNLSKGNKVKYYQFQVIEKNIHKTVEEKTRKHVEGLADEILYMKKKIDKDKETLEKSGSPSLRKKVEKAERALAEKWETYQRVFFSTFVNLLKEWTTEKLPKSIEKIRKQEGCCTLLPLQCKISLPMQQMGFFSSYAQADCELGGCIDPKDDCTSLILKDLGIEDEEKEKKEKKEEKEKPKAKKEQKSEK